MELVAVYDWTNEPTDEKRKRKYLKRFMKCYNVFVDFVNEHLERWNEELAELDEEAYNKEIVSRENKAIEKLMKKKPCFWNKGLSADYTWYVNDDACFRMTIREPLNPKIIGLGFHFKDA